MEFFWPVVYYLIPGMLLGFGFAVYPHRERLGSACAPLGRRLWQALPGTAMCWGRLLMLASEGMLAETGAYTAEEIGRLFAEYKKYADMLRQFLYKEEYL